MTPASPKLGGLRGPSSTYGYLLSTSRSELAQVLLKLESGGNTKLYKAAYKAVQLASANQANTIVLFTDGEPSDSPSRALESLYDEFVQNGGTVIVIAVGVFDFDRIDDVASQLHAIRVIKSSDPNETAQEVVKGFADVL